MFEKNKPDPIQDNTTYGLETADDASDGQRNVIWRYWRQGLPDVTHGAA